tara:strand:- start:3226 stop:3429 length:204 start_codon:yes stop_codon:yes gene_type:complete
MYDIEINALVVTKGTDIGELISNLLKNLMIPVSIQKDTIELQNELGLEGGLISEVIHFIKYKQNFEA